MALQAPENQAKLLATTRQSRSPVSKPGLVLWQSPDLTPLSATGFASGTNKTKALEIKSAFLRNGLALLVLKKQVECVLRKSFLKK